MHRKLRLNKNRRHKIIKVASDFLAVEDIVLKRSKEISGWCTVCEAEIKNCTCLDGLTLTIGDEGDNNA